VLSEQHQHLGAARRGESSASWNLRATCWIGEISPRRCRLPRHAWPVLQEYRRAHPSGPIRVIVSTLLRLLRRGDSRRGRDASVAQLISVWRRPPPEPRREAVQSVTWLPSRGRPWGGAAPAPWPAPRWVPLRAPSDAPKSAGIRPGERPGRGFACRSRCTFPSDFGCADFPSPGVGRC
jgi:hypothetical protein